MVTAAPQARLENPFPGLRSFTSEESHLFFGREGQSDELLRKMDRKHFVAVVGVSGSGKSSLVRAGLLPSLYNGYLARAGAEWRVADFRPGGDPITSLAAALSGTGLWNGGLDANVLRASSLALVGAARQARDSGQWKEIETTSLTAIRQAADQEGYRVEGFAPTSRAAQKLADSGIESSTLQRHLASNEPDDGQKRLYILDESSLASTRQMNQFLHGLKENDRVLLVGDVRQHQAVEAGAPYQQLQEAGIYVAHLDEIVRQRDPALKEVVAQLSRGHTREAMEKLDSQGRVHEIGDRGERFRELANEYAKQPEGTLVVSPDNQSRMEINQVIHAEMQARGQVDHREERLKVLVARQEITGADRQWAEQYQPGNIVRYTKGSKTSGIKAGEYARVERIDAKENLVSVKKQTGKQVTYDPRRLQGVTLYREADRAFSRGDRVQFTAPDREQHIANRELATVEKIDGRGNIRVRLDSGRSVAFNIKKNPHLDYGYAMTSHSSQGQTADRVLINVDTDQAGEKLVNRRLAYVAVSRGRYDAQIYTNDKTQLAEGLSRDVSRRTAMEAHRESAGPAKRQSPELELERERTRTQSYDIGR